MKLTDAAFTVCFPDWYDERAEYEHCSKGFLPDVKVRKLDGSLCRLYIVDPTRLGQDLEAYVEQGRPYLAEPGLVVVPEVTRAAITTAVEGLAKDGFFDHLRFER